MIGHLIGQLAHHSLAVIGSVGSNEKLIFINEELNFEEGFNYIQEKLSGALARRRDRPQKV